MEQHQQPVERNQLENTNLPVEQHQQPAGRYQLEDTNLHVEENQQPVERNQLEEINLPVEQSCQLGERTNLPFGQQSKPEKESKAKEEVRVEKQPVADDVATGHAAPREFNI